MSVNKVILIGNVGRDPEIRYVETKPRAAFPLATNDPPRTAPDGTRIPERVEWHAIVMWGAMAETAERYIRRGTRLYIEGKIRYRTWEDRNTIKRTVAEIEVDNFEFLSRGNSNDK